MLALLLGVAVATPCEMLLGFEPVPQRGGRCLSAAVAMSLSSRGRGLNPVELEKGLPVGAHGEEPYDLQVELKERGWQSLVFEGALEQGAQLVEAGYSPVAFLDEKGIPHAVTVVGVRRQPSPDGRCLGTLDQLAIVDPRAGTVEWRSASAMETAAYGRRMLVAYLPASSGSLDDAGFPVAQAMRSDRRFRAQTLVTRAQARAAPDETSIQLLEAAVAADPTWAVARQLLHDYRSALLDPPP